MVTIHCPAESWTTDLLLLQGNFKFATELKQRIDKLVIQILILCLVAKLSRLPQVNVCMRMQFFVLNIFLYLNKGISLYSCTQSIHRCVLSKSKKNAHNIICTDNGAYL